MLVRIEKYAGAPVVVFGMHLAGAAAAALAAPLLWACASRLFARPGRAIVGLGFWVRAGLGVLALSLLVTGAWGQDNPRAVWRGFLLVVISLGGLVGLLALSASDAKRDNWRRRIKWLDVGLFNLFLLLLLLELALRGFGAISPNALLASPNVKAAARVAAMKLRPGQMHMGFPANSRGFYDTEWTPAKPAGVVRVLGLADSFGVETVPYDRNYLTVLEDLLDRPQRLVEVMNLAVNGTSPRAYLYHLREFFRPWGADYAVVSLFLGNDILNLPQKRQTLSFLRRDFWYLGFVPRRLLALAREDRARKAGVAAGMDLNQLKLQGRTGPTFSPEAYLEVEVERLPVCLREGRDPVVESRYKELRGILHDLRESADGRLAVLIIPDEFQVNDALWQEALAASRLTPEQVERQRPQRELQAMCEELGIPVLDLLPALRMAQKEEGDTYHLRDTHWNPRGHRVAAQAAAAFLAPLLERLPKEKQ